MFKCDYCNVKFTRDFNRKRHMKKEHINMTRVYVCRFCDQSFASPTDLINHRTTHAETVKDYKLEKSAFKGMLRQYRRTYEDIITLNEAFEMDKIPKRTLVKYLLEEIGPIQTSICYCIQFKKLGAEGQLANITELVMRSFMQRIFNMGDLEELEEEAFSCFEQRIDDFVHNGSGWIVNEVLYSEISVSKIPALN